MSLALVLLLGCEQDLLLMGNITGLGSAPATAPATLATSVPTVPVAAPITPALLNPIPNGGVIEGAAEAPVEAAAAPPPPVKFNPISIPEGPREGDGVRWEGVKVKGRAPPPISSRLSKGPDRDFLK